MKKKKGEQLVIEAIESMSVGHQMAYFEAYQKRYGEKCRPDVGGKIQGVVKALLRDIPLNRACDLVQVYLQMDTKWFITKAHDIVTFKENLNVIGNALDTGKNPGGVDWDKFNWGDGIMKKE
jgi:hypothetical protein